MNEETIWVEATIDADGFPAVAVSFEGHTEIRRAEEFREFAITLLTAAAIAENEVAIAEGVEQISQPKGFQKKPLTADSMSVQMVRILRNFRPSLSFGIHSFRGLRTGKALVTHPWPTREDGLQFDLDTARSHAMSIIVAAEAAETDAFLRHFVTFKLGLSIDEAQALVMEFREFRTRVQLERLLG